MERDDHLENMSVEELRKELASRIQSVIDNPKVPESIKSILRKGEDGSKHAKSILKVE